MKARVKRLIINPEQLLHIMQNNTAWRVIEGVPKTARLRGITIDPYTQVLHLFAEDESFEEVDIEREVAPQLKTVFRKVQ